MGITVLSALGLIFQIVGFVYLCRLGARVSNALQQKSKWLPLVVSSVVITVGVLTCFAYRKNPAFAAQTAGFFCVAFGGGIVARQLNQIRDEK